MRRALALLVAVVALGGVALAATQSLPQNHKLERSGRFRQTTETMWNTVTDLGSAATWRTDLDALERQPDVRGHEVWRETRGGQSVTLETAEQVGKRRLVRCVVDQAGPFRGCWTVVVAPRDKVESVVTVTESLTIHSLGWRLTHFRSGRRGAIDAFLLALGAKFGETPKLSDTPRGL